MRGWRRQVQSGLPTILGLARRGFFIPYRHADSVDAYGPAYAPIETLFEKYAEDFAAMLASAAMYDDAFHDIGAAPPPEPRWRQDWFPRLDAAIAYVMIRREKPARIVEVGSGHSTRFFARAVRDEGLATEIIAIDPAPRADLAGLAAVRLHRMLVQDAAMDVFAALKAGDVLSIDSSHILMPGSDVDFLLNRVLPHVPSGVIVHIHDMFLPDGYPLEWEWRGYNEQLGVSVLLNSGGWTPLFSSQYVLTRMQDVFDNSVIAKLHLESGALESGLWLKKE
ncbi:MAG: class I SAM-dependent methyltransferase [Alphaproteobacteria bacterium]|nr:class I SAM-dependent methyltransferase [Alphaproteobacteria bacterium]